MNKKITKIYLILIALQILGCDDNETSSSNDQQIQLDNNQALWGSQKIVNYQYSLFFEIGDGSRKTETVYVQNSIATANLYLDDGQAVELVDEMPFITFDNWFDYIQKVLDDEEIEVTVTYDSNYGFPIYLSTVSKEKNIADGSTTFKISDFQ